MMDNRITGSLTLAVALSVGFLASPAHAIYTFSASTADGYVGSTGSAATQFVLGSGVTDYMLAVPDSYPTIYLTGNTSSVLVDGLGNDSTSKHFRFTIRGTSSATPTATMSGGFVEDVSVTAQYTPYTAGTGGVFHYDGGVITRQIVAAGGSTVFYNNPGDWIGSSGITIKDAATFTIFGSDFVVSPEDLTTKSGYDVRTISGKIDGQPFSTLLWISTSYTGEINLTSGDPTLGQINLVSVSVPEPATLGLFALGGILIFRRRTQNN